MTTTTYQEGNMFTVEDFAIGQRVELHPAHGAWMAGDRFGVVVKIGRTLVHVRMDRSGALVSLAPRNIGRIVGA